MDQFIDEEAHNTVLNYNAKSAIKKNILIENKGNYREPVMKKTIRSSDLHDVKISLEYTFLRGHSESTGSMFS